MPVRKMIVLVPTIDQMNVIASATSALCSPASMSVAEAPNPACDSRLFSTPVAAKKRCANMPITTHEIAVGRK